VKAFMRLLLICISFIYSSAPHAQAPDNPPCGDVKQIFPASPLNKNHLFHFKGKFEEILIRTPDNIRLHAILFHADSSKGVIFYLHGNNGGLDKWGKIAPVYTALHFDIFMFDYRGYGKSEGRIRNEKQLYNDVQSAYDLVKVLYPEKNIIILGYSIGTGPAAMLASTNHPEKLILQAPYYSLNDAVHFLDPGFDTTRMPFQFNTYLYLPKVSCPVVIFHGDADKTFYYGSSQKLKYFFKPGDELITLKGAGHPDMEKNKDYLLALKEVLDNVQ
jgi:uncharacterized protein